MLFVCLAFTLAGCNNTGVNVQNDKEIQTLATAAKTPEEVKALIDKIPEGIEESEEIDAEVSNNIVAARTAYNALSESDQAKIDETTMAKLQTAEAEIKSHEAKGATTRAVGWIIEMLYKLTSLVGLGSYALAIFLLTVILKVVLHPLIIRQQRTMKSMQSLQPKMKAIEQKYGNNPQKRQEMTMKLYKDEGVSPFSSCLPLLAQMPIILILFYGLRTFTPLFPEDYTFIWIPYLRLAVDATPMPWLLPIACAVFTMLQQYLGMANRRDMTQRIMLFIIPIMFLFIVRQFPSGLALYWLFYAITSIFQMSYINWRLKLGIFAPKEVKEAGETNKKRGAITKAADDYFKEHPEEAEKAQKKGRYTPPEQESLEGKNVVKHTHNATVSYKKSKDNRDKPWH